MKRIISLFMCVVMVFSMFTVTVNAAENHFAKFDSEVMKLWFAVVFGGGEDNIYEFTPHQIKWVVNFKIDATQYDSYEELVEYTYGDQTYSYTVIHYQIPADVYEAEALKRFNISDINTLRNDTSTSPVYNAEKHIYDMPDGGGMGDSITYVTKGYKDLGNGKYEVYGYTVEQAYDKPADAVEGVDYIIHNDYPVEILKCLKVTIEFDGNDVKFISWETVSLDVIPDIQDLIHIHVSPDWIVDEFATCTETGLKHKKCAKCGEVFETTVIPAIGHSYGDWIITSESTCTQEGSQSKTCSSCNDVVIEAIPTTRHTVVKDIAVEATCTTAGKTEGSHCSVCNTVITAQTIIVAKGHKFSDLIVETSATCTSAGKGVKICTECGEMVYEVIPASGHQPSNWIIDKNANVYKDGEKYKECTECGEVLATASIAQLKCSKPKLKEISNTEDGVEITWGKVSGADKYVVYRKTGSGSYKEIGSTKKTSYTDKKATSGKKYYYVVKAVNEAGKSESSSSLSKLYLADTTLKTPSSTKKGVVLKWSKVTGAEGYQVWRKTGSGSYSKVATVKGNSKVTYTDESAKKGKTYTYKIKAYKSKTTSAYSNAKKIKDKY